MTKVENFLESIQDDALKVLSVEGSKIKINPLKFKQALSIETESLEYLAQMIAEELNNTAKDNRAWDVYKTLISNIFKNRGNLTTPTLGRELEQAAIFSEIAVEKFEEVIANIDESKLPEESAMKYVSFNFNLGMLKMDDISNSSKLKVSLLTPDLMNANNDEFSLIKEELEHSIPQDINQYDERLKFLAILGINLDTNVGTEKITSLEPGDVIYVIEIQLQPNKPEFDYTLFPVYEVKYEEH
ncbi:MAG: hypothetical protein AAGJ08_25135 [Cyanobacteria bacterium P01_H01_bin.35]